jgi:mRNA export factor
VLSTAGSDGTFSFWDMASKHRLKSSPDVGNPVTATAWNIAGDKLAYAVGYDWNKGFAFNQGQESKIMVHKLGEVDCKPRPRR